MIKSEEMQNICRSMTVTDRVSTMLICFHGKKEGNLYGEILNCYIDGPVWFSDIGDLMLKLDEICDWVGTPQPTTNPRFLNKKMSEEYAHRTKGKNKIPVKAKIQLQDSLTLSTRAVHAKETLIVKIEHRQNASLQGIVAGRLTSRNYVAFRSALELMRMIKEIAVRT
ncbi:MULTISPECIES: hypothetical protein [Lacrimispora]|jgi:hypothetical protein|uniref:Uncharacterized protein n=1 Tax=Lacrimispora sphenoides JCM 1415 TaxID=1297793 RepID=A0ABY1C0R8_9FIRM|nr:MULTISPECIES: hypothetical protein [Lacrimispora]EXG85170.1 hypothetical protein K413DRAFT_1949 [Clostridium sp. ASBs410]MDR7810822.1 hypothetical protein [Lacrimispora sp.]SET49418.1 hypothetical protein SAMN02745906_0044 [[Clostridium] sphenoides JCM 1415]SET51999.1 hypothetical protein SAMN05443270_0345 [Lacrimispora sphenoides]SUY49444.1 Uncharacterised protein [Lacrimispora sphenoides]